MVSKEWPTADAASVDQRRPIAGTKGFSAGAFWGAMLGVNGWVIGMLCYAIAVGELGTVWSVVLGGFVLSTGVGLLLLLPSARPGSGDWLGRLLIALSLISTLYMHWAHPQLKQAPRLAGLIDSYVLSDLAILSMGLAGIIVVALARTLSRRADAP